MAGTPAGPLEYRSEYGVTPETIFWDYADSLTKYQLPTLTEPGYKFLGWYGSPDFKEESKIEIGDTLMKDGRIYTTILYAKWRRIPQVYEINGSILEDMADSIRKVLNKNQKFSPFEMECELKGIPSAEGLEF